MKLNAATITWYFLHYAKKLGLWGWLALLLILLSCSYYQTDVKSLEAETALLIMEKERAEQRLQMPVQDEIVDEVPGVSGDDVTDFYDRFATVDAMPEVLQTINTLAAKQKIALNSGDYKLDKLKLNSSPVPKTLTKYQISFPISGGYRNVRRFTADVLNKLPGIALVDMQIKRENTANNLVEASLVYVLFVKGESW